MKINTLFRLSGMILLAVVASLAMLVLIYLTQHPQLIATIATVSWNG